MFNKRTYDYVKSISADKPTTVDVSTAVIEALSEVLDKHVERIEKAVTEVVKDSDCGEIVFHGNELNITFNVYMDGASDNQDSAKSKADW